MFNLKAILSERIAMHDIRIIIQAIQADEKLKQEIYNLAFDDDGLVGFQAVWVLTHLSSKESNWLNAKHNELINKVLICEHGGKRRLFLTLIQKQPQSNPPRVDFLNYCLEKMQSANELPGVRSLCMKIAYQLCLSAPELILELKTILNMMETDSSPALQATRKNILKTLKKESNINVFQHP